MAKNRQNQVDAIIKYFVSRGRDDNFVVEIPAKWKVTFSHVNPQAQGRGYSEGYCLRFYEGEKLRAVFNNVTGFRDLSIPLMREVRTETGSRQWTQDSQGNFSEQAEVSVNRRLESPPGEPELENEGEELPF